MKMSTKTSDEMYLCHQVQFTSNSEYFDKLKEICHNAKNLYNAALWYTNEYYEVTGESLSWMTLDKIFNKGNPDYKQLPVCVAQHVEKKVGDNFNSYFKALKQYNKNPGKFLEKPKKPNYLPKDGYFIAEYTRSPFNKKSKQFYLPKRVDDKSDPIYFKSVLDKKDIAHMVLTPKFNKDNANGYFVLNIVYKVKKSEPLVSDGGCASIDLGVRNFATLTSNRFKPLLIKGGPLLYINHNYNKSVAYYTSVLQAYNKEEKVYNTKRLTAIARNRDNRVRDFLHKQSKLIVDKLVENNISLLVVGYNPEWKQEVNLGKKNNQNFVAMPHCKFKEMLKYKCEMRGITFVEQEESHTSKCSFIDNEDIGNHDTYVGTRAGKKFTSKDGKIINADVNGSLNIARKYLTEHPEETKDIVWTVESTKAMQTPSSVRKAR